MLLTEQDANQIREALASQVPYVNVYRSTLGGEERASIMITISLDPRDQWQNGILENSYYGKFAVHRASCFENKLEYFSGTLPKFRKVKVKSAQDAIVKLFAQIVKSKALRPETENRRPVDIISERVGK